MSEAGDALVLFMPSGRRGRFPLGTALLQAARQLGVDIDSVCGGRGICGRCQIELTEGQFAKHGITSRAAHITPLSEPEQRFAERRGLASGRRLSCHTRLQGDAVIDVPPDSQVHRQVVRKAAEARDIEIDPVVRLCYVEVPPPDIDHPSGDQERLLAALADQWGLQNLSCDLRLLPDLQALLRQGQWRVTAAVQGEQQVVALWPGLQERISGVALDIGSTTLSAHLCDLATGEVLAGAGRMNPQIRFGEDLMSRVSWVMMHPGGEAELTAAVREAVNGLLADLVAEAGISADAVLALTVAANPIMHHLFLGLSPVELGGAPFALAVDGPVRASAADLGLAINPGAGVYALPCIAGHVGADAAGVLLAEAPHKRPEVNLIVDVGTNAEILLGNRERLLAASSPTGPAFEGAQISGGQRAAPGAIERVRIDRQTLEPRFKVIGCELWSDEPGFEEAAAATGVTGICGSGIIEALAELYLAGVIDPDGVIDAAFIKRTPRIRQQGRTCAYLLREARAANAPDIEITQNDVRAVQLAKAALYAGVKLLMARFGAARVDRIRLAGAFGSFIDVQYAMVLGLIPDCALDEVSAAGNAAGTGARMALLNAAARTEVEALVKNIEKIEIATATDFQEQFVNAMAIPHKTDPFPNLNAAVTLPPPKKSQAAAKRRRRQGTSG